MMRDNLTISTMPVRAGLGTSAPGFHMPETLDWSSVAARIKNRTLIVPSGTVIHNSIVLRDLKGSKQREQDGVCGDDRP